VLLQIHLVASVMFLERWNQRLTSSSNRLQNFNNPIAQTTWDSSRGYLPNGAWFLPFIGPLVAILLLLLLGPWVFKLLEVCVFQASVIPSQDHGGARIPTYTITGGSLFL